MPKFDGLTSRIDCGSYHDLTGDVTILAWVKPHNAGEGGQGFIISNAQFVIQYLTDKLYFLEVFLKSLSSWM